MRQRSGTAEERYARLLDLQSLLAGVASEIGPALELQPVLASVLVAMRSLVGFRGGTVCLIDDEGVYVAAADPAVSPEVAAAHVPVGTGLSGRVITTGESIYSPDIGDDPRVDQQLRRLGSNAPMRSYLAVPLVCLGRVIGLMQIDSTEVDAFDTEDMRVLQGLATQVGGAIESARHNEQVMELERLKSDFLARASHELRTPLTILNGFVDTLVTWDAEIDERQRKAMLRRVDSAAHRLSDLVEELLTVTQFEASALVLEQQHVGVRDVLLQVQSQAVEPKLVNVRCAGDLTVETDPRLLRQALSLLVHNALRYAGDADMRAGADDDGAHYVEVVDHGPGIAEELRGRIFERFFRGSHAEHGLGLGLPLVRNLAGAMGARVDLTHPPAGGACFRLTFAAR